MKSFEEYWLSLSDSGRLAVNRKDLHQLTWDACAKELESKLQEMKKDLDWVTKRLSFFTDAEMAEGYAARNKEIRLKHGLDT